MKKALKTVVTAILILVPIFLFLFLDQLFDLPFLNDSYFYYASFAYVVFFFVFILLRETLKTKLLVSILVGVSILIIAFSIVAVLKVEHGVMELLRFITIISILVLMLRNAMKEWNEKNP